MWTPTGSRAAPTDGLRRPLGPAAPGDGVAPHAPSWGLPPGGVDRGTRRVPPLELPRPLLVIGEGVSTYEAGEMWHLLDHRFELAVTLVPGEDLGRVDFADYSHVILVDGEAALYVERGARGLLTLPAADDAEVLEAALAVGDLWHLSYGHILQGHAATARE